MRILGIDYGAARVGLAMGDTGSRLATPLMVLQEKDLAAVIQRIQTLVQEEGIDRLVVGVPRPFGDQMGETAQGESVQRFIERLKEKGLIVEEANEVLSSRMAMHHTHELGQKRKRDDLAATIILQSWLDVSKEE